MTNWNEGYVSEIGYTYGYYTELNPLRVRLAMLNAGLAVPEIKSACELGFGQGVSINVHAAASSVSWTGNDFNPAQTNFAHELARASGTDAALTDESFAEFCLRDDLPNFDYIGLHGIWSWISDANRQLIVDFIKRKLNVGGVVYISYNTLPGWSNFAPVRHLMVQHERRMSGSGIGMVSRIESALGFADKLLATHPVYLSANPAAKARYELLQKQDRHYLAHEYFNQDWQPMYFADMAEWLAAAKVTFACSANYLDHISQINFTPEQSELLAGIEDRTFIETTRDFLVNQQFRKDYWVKGARTLSELERLELLRDERVVLTTHRSDVSLKANGPLGEVTMHDAVYNPVLDVMADHMPRTLGEIETVVVQHNVTLPQIIEVMLVLGSHGHVTSAQINEVVKASKKSANDLNAFLIKRAQGSGEISILVSPVTGGAVTVARFSQLFIDALQRGEKSSDDLAKHVWAILASQNQAIVKDGKVLEGEAANLSELKEQAEVFLQKQLPILKALEITG